MTYTPLGIRLWRTEKGDIGKKLNAEFTLVKTEYDGVNTASYASYSKNVGAGATGYRLIGLPPTVSTAASLYTWSYGGYTFSDKTTIAIAVVPLGTVIPVPTVSIKTGSVDSTSVIFSTSAAGATFSAIAYGK